MRAGFIPTRPERKERNMAVPASKRARTMGEYVRQARIVLAETQHVMRIVYEVYTADVIYASTVEEQRLRLERIYAAYGRINALAGLVDLWIDQPPQAAAPHMGPYVDPSYYGGAYCRFALVPAFSFHRPGRIVTPWRAWAR